MRTVPVNPFETVATLRSLASEIAVNSFTVDSTAVMFEDQKKNDPKVGTPGPCSLMTPSGHSEDVWGSFDYTKNAADIR